jgi:hypothetical protein
MTKDSKEPKTALKLTKETITSLHVKTNVATGMKPLKSFPNACISVQYCPPPSGNGACFP